jgi:ethanolamine utilization protein EutL
MNPLKRMPPRILARRVLPHADARVAEGLGGKPGATSLAFFTCDQDDSLYAALDHATKMANVEVSFARSFYSGSAHASGALSGEIMGVLSAHDPETLAAGVAACESALESLFSFFAIGDAGVSVFPTVIGRCGHYLSAQAGIAQGEPLAYLIAPPMEAMLGVDAALKAAAVTLCKLMPPPSETNFAGAYLTGTLHALQAARDAFVSAIIDVVARPRV